MSMRFWKVGMRSYKSNAGFQQAFNRRHVAAGGNQDFPTRHQQREHGADKSKSIIVIQYPFLVSLFYNGRLQTVNLVP